MAPVQRSLGWNNYNYRHGPAKAGLLAFSDKLRYNSIIMTYIYHVLRHGPIGLWSFDATPLIDSSGYGNDATFSGSPVTTRPIVAGGIAAQHLDTGDTINYPVDTIMIEGRDARAFSLEAWIKPGEGSSTIMARDNSGLFIDGLNLIFSVEFDSLISVEYNHLDAGNVYHVVASYTGSAIELYVNGVMVIGSNIDDSEILAGFADTTTNLKTLTTATLVADSVAVYNYALSSAVVNQHYQYGIQYPEIESLSLLNGGKYYLISDNTASVYKKLEFGPVDDWTLGLFDGNITAVDENLVNTFDETAGEWLTGTWTYQYSVDSDIGDGVVLNGSRINWDSNVAITVETSVDDVVWTPVTNGSQIVGTQDLSSGYVIAIKITLPGTVDEQASVDSLSVVFYTSKNINGSDTDLPAVFIDPLTVALADTEFDPASFNDNAGVLLPVNNGFEIAEDPEFGGYFAVEFTAKFDTSTFSKTVLYVDSPSAQPSITSNGSGQWVSSNLTALYIDGVSVASPFTIATGKWHHVLAVFAESQDTVIIGNNAANSAGYPMRVGYVALYSDNVTASMADAIYDTWVGAPAIQIVEDDVPEISEHIYSDTGGPFRGYSFDWSITGAG